MGILDKLELDTLLLAAILVTLIAQILLGQRGRETQLLRRHNDRLIQSLSSPAFDHELTRATLIEASVMAEIDTKLHELQEMNFEQFSIKLAEVGHPEVSDSKRQRIWDMIRNGPMAALGGKLFDKLLGLFNKTMGFG
ncbi:MAG: hypothetical protein U0S50_10575 [Sphingopyxis sp.]|uniref:hypothetical protein n=1 Tax=Sphingopyxis sp. TaxID=1908224 RepID=UPI002AB86A1B|nr:hypothetical protein [Sphingopyxis sp.]MDZ3832250.1 hypothetical protein [Sphingopyxis sp.]